MPLLDHFHPPLSRTHPWRGFHGAWAAAIARLLNQGVLPPGYYAVPFVDREGPIEIDVAALRASALPDSGGAPVAVRQWAPVAPALAVPIELPTGDDVRIEVFTDDGDPRLAAAIELVSPRNKDRPAARQTFLAKCVGYLGRGCGVVTVDTVTTRRAELHGELLNLLGAEAVDSTLASMCAVSYVVSAEPAGTRLLAWPESLSVGEPLPTLPLWLAADVAVPLDLEASYEAACADLRVRTAG